MNPIYTLNCHPDKESEDSLVLIKAVKVMHLTNQVRRCVYLGMKRKKTVVLKLPAYGAPSPQLNQYIAEKKGRLKLDFTLLE